MTPNICLNTETGNVVCKPKKVIYNIDSINFVLNEEGATWWGDEYYAKNENIINICDSLTEIIVKNGILDEYGWSHIYNPQIEFYLFDYKIPIEHIRFKHGYEVYIDSSKGNMYLIPGVDDLYVGTGLFDYIPTTSIEAIMFVEFAKQHGINAIKINGCTVTWHEEYKSLIFSDDINHNKIIVYGAYNGELSGNINLQEYDGGESNEGVTFPVYLERGDNGQTGIDTFNYLINKYSYPDNIHIKEEIYCDNILMTDIYKIFDTMIVIVNRYPDSLAAHYEYILNAEGYLSLGGGGGN